MLKRGVEAEQIADAISRSRDRVETRAQVRPIPTIDPSLPIYSKREDITRALRDHQVIVVVGETGSGKSTQLPKLCLNLGRGIKGFIGHTQPRRIAARSIATRIAQEMGTQIGREVGYKFRFKDRVSRDAYIKVMTDGILLSELESDRKLLRYDTLIIDEAHERSLNIDFLLGYLKKLLPKRPELKLVVTSATIDAQRFSDYFDAPVIEVTGRTFPVELRYREPGEGSYGITSEEAIAEAIAELPGHIGGDVLVFLPGEREIRRTADFLRKLSWADTEILPLYGRLTVEQQQAVFRSHSGRRVVLATNVAETSITVPGIRYVVDTGLARISRYRPGRQIQALPVEPVSRASADQRKGRCGREADGICIRLYSESDFDSRPEFTEPEVLRTSLASVILKMLALGLGDIAKFPFLEPPSPAMIRDGYRLLEELGALDSDGILTRTGKKLSTLPLDPRLGRVLLEAGSLGCVTEVTLVCAALSIQDPRSFAPPAEQAAREKHKRYEHPDSDFLAFLNLWDHYAEQTKAMTRRQKRRYCRQNYLSYSRMEEWRDIHRQLTELACDLGLTRNEKPADAAAVHLCILSGYLGNVGHRLERDQFAGTRGKSFLIHPASRRKHPGRWIVCGELIDTKRLYGRTTAKVRPEWVESAASHLVKRAYHDPHWQKAQGKVLAHEQVSLFGLVLVAGRTVNYGPIHPSQAREIFLREGVVPDQLEGTSPFQEHNRELFARVRALEHRSRRHDIMVDEQTLFGFFDQRIPQDVYDLERFFHWYRRASKLDPSLLYLSEELLMQRPAEEVTVRRFPESIRVGENELACRYHFRPGHPNDGVTVTVPLALLSQLDDVPFSWLVPGLLLEKIIGLMRGLPKSRRKALAPIAETAERCLEKLEPGRGALTASLSVAVESIAGARIEPTEWNEDKLTEHLKMNFEVLDPSGEAMGYGRDLGALQERLKAAPAIHTKMDTPQIEQQGITCWDFPDLPESIQVNLGQVTVARYPALTDENTSVAIRALEYETNAAVEHRAGLRRLLMLTLPRHVKQITKISAQIQQMCLLFSTVGPCDTLRRDLTDAAIDHILFDTGDVRRRAIFEEKSENAKKHLVSAFNEICEASQRSLELYQSCVTKIAGLPDAAREDIEKQLAGLVYPGFVSATGLEQLQHLPRYMRAVLTRIERAKRSPQKDASGTAQIAPHLPRLEEIQQISNPAPELLEYRWLVEEYRVSVFAQNLGTRVPVSAKRLEEKWRAVEPIIAHGRS